MTGVLVPGSMSEKVATELIQAYGTIDNLLDSIETVEPVRIRDKYVLIECLLLEFVLTQRADSNFQKIKS